MNQLVLCARIVQRDALRYTPAGLPVVDLRLAHESERFQEGQTRKLSLEVTACALGELARDLVTIALGTAGNFTGFLVKHRNGRGVMLQIESFSALPPDPTPPH